MRNSPSQANSKLLSQWSVLSTEDLECFQNRQLVLWNHRIHLEALVLHLFIEISLSRHSHHPTTIPCTVHSRLVLISISFSCNIVSIFKILFSKIRSSSAFFVDSISVFCSDRHNSVTFLQRVKIYRRSLSLNILLTVLYLYWRQRLWTW